MKTRTTLGAALALSVLAFAAGRSLSQPPAEPKPPAPPAPAPAPAVPAGATDAEQLAARLAEDSAPVAEHKVLEALTGTFAVESRLHLDPAAAPLVSRGTGEGRWILGERFVKAETTVGQDRELKAQTLTLYGFDTRTRKYTVLALDTFGTYWASAEGDYDAEARELRLTGVIEEHGERFRFKWNVKMEDGKNTQTVLVQTDGSAWMKAAEVVQTRK